MTSEFPLAVHGLVYLLHTNRVTSSAELADNICTNPARVRKVMAQLHKAGLVTASEGHNSGYRAIPNSDGISLRTVMEALRQQAVELSWRSGDMDRDCQIASGMAGIMDGVYDEMNQACLRRLDTITIGQITQFIFEKGAE